MEKILKECFYSPDSPAFMSGSAQALSKVIKKTHPDIKVSLKEIQQFLDIQTAYSLHRNARRNYPRNKILAPGPNIQLSADLADFSNIRKKNRGFCFILAVVDVFSKKAFAEPLKSKKASDVAEALSKIFKRVDETPDVLTTDFGNEFVNVKVRALLKRNKVFLFPSQGEKKNAIVERFLRTLKSRIYRHFDSKMTRNWIDILQNIIAAYNASYHRSIGCAPNEVGLHNTLEVYQRLYGDQESVQDPTLKVDDIVRINLKLPFAKAYEATWSRAVHKVIEGPYYTRGAKIPTYRIEHMDGSPIPGRFLPQELLKVSKSAFFDDYDFPIDRVLRRKGNKKLVSFMGYPATSNTWITNDNVSFY